MNEIMEKIGATGILPVLSLEDVESALPVARALYDEGFSCAEIAFRTRGADEAIRAIRTALPDLSVGAGGVENAGQAAEAIAAGAEFISSAILNPQVVKYCAEKGVLSLSACSSADDVEMAAKSGVRAVKFFVAGGSGDAKVLQGIAASYPDVRFVVTGDIDPKRLGDFLSPRPVLAWGVRWTCEATSSEEMAASVMRNRAWQARQALFGFELIHIGINSADEAEAETTAKFFSTMFGFEYLPTATSIFAGVGIEAMKFPHYGRLGHIAIRTGQMERAVNYLKSRGIDMNESSAKSDEKGLIAVYFQQEIAGFAIHLLRRK